MKALLLSILLVASIHTGTTAQTEHVLETANLRVVVDLETGGVAQIQDMLRPNSPLVFDLDSDILEIAAGDLRPFGFLVTGSGADFVSLTSSVFLGETTHLPLRVTITYRVAENRLSADYCFEALRLLELEEGLDIKLSSSSCDSILIRNQFSGEPPIDCGQSNGRRRLGWNQIYEFRNSLRNVTLVFANPYQSVATIETTAPDSFLFSWHVLIACEPNKAKEPIGPPLASVLSPGTKVRRQIELIVTHEHEALADMKRPIAYFSPFPDGYEQVISMIYDDIPFGGDPPKSGHDPDSKDAQYLVRLLDDHPKMKMGWVLLPDAIWSDADIANPDYPPGKWWLAHSTRRLLTTYSEDYLQWIRNVERDSLVYGYEDRARVGSHGYHHVPEREERPNHEFQYYDPVTADSTFAAMVREFQLLGLSPKSHRFIRFPGFAFTRAAIDALIENDFILFDYWWSGPQGPMLPFLFFYSEHGRIWGITSRWNGDLPSPYEVMEGFLGTGKICLTNGHPYATFDRWDNPEASYLAIDAQFRQAETDFPNLGYMFPDEIGYFADETQDIYGIKSEIVYDAFVCFFHGSVTLGQTLVVEWPDEIPFPTTVTVDGLHVADAESRGRRFVICLPPLTDGAHVVRMSPFPGDLYGQHPPPYDPGFFQNEPNPFRSETVIRYWLSQAGHVTLTIFDLLGRRVVILVDAEQDAGMNVAPWNGRDNRGEKVASGIYFCRLDAGGKTQMRKLTLVR